MTRLSRVELEKRVKAMRVPLEGMLPFEPDVTTKDQLTYLLGWIDCQKEVLSILESFGREAK